MAALYLMFFIILGSSNSANASACKDKCNGIHEDCLGPFTTYSIDVPNKWVKKFVGDNSKKNANAVNKGLIASNDSLVWRVEYQGEVILLKPNQNALAETIGSVDITNLKTVCDQKVMECYKKCRK